MNATLLLQARTNSSRLPGKVLLPIGGVPLVVLAARRAGNSGHRVIVVTSHERSDDALCEALKSWGVEYFRGELDNTLKRFVDALENLADDEVVVRLTGDNVIPDGDFIDELLIYFEQRKIPYLCCGGELSGLPYGVSAEVTRAKYLREAHQYTESGFDREHVTPWIIDKYGRNDFLGYQKLEMQQWRCTVDTLDDYLLVSKLFGHDETGEQLPLEVLLDRLREAATDVFMTTPASRMVLGTAQFGLNYGIANNEGRPEQSKVNQLIRTAIVNGVQYIDSARAYGESEYVVGKALSNGLASRATVITKLSPLNDCPIDAEPTVVRVFVERSVYQSCHALNAKKLDVLMLHRCSHLTKWQGAVWRTVSDLKQQGVIKELGVSVQSPEEALDALDFQSVSFIQLPFNVLDDRWDSVVGKIAHVRKGRKLIIHARSALLQGLLTTDHDELWQRAWCTKPASVIDWLRAKAQQHTHDDVVNLCIRFVLSQKWIDGLVMGVDNQEQLVHNLANAAVKPWNEATLASIVNDRPFVSYETLNPATWKQTND